MKDAYPYIVSPAKVDKIRSEGIPLPKLPTVLPVPEKVKRRFLGTIVFVLSLAAFVALNILTKNGLISTTVFLKMLYMFITAFVALISLVASIFEFVQYSRMKKQYNENMDHYNSTKEAYSKIKQESDQIEAFNKDENKVNEYRLGQIIDMFNNCYDNINAIKNEYSLPKKRFKLFLEEYFPNEVLDNVKISNASKNINYIPDFIIKFADPKLNVAIEIEEPYTLSNVPENIQKVYDAKDVLRQRFADESNWIVIVISEEQAIRNPVECCKFIEGSIEVIFGKIKSSDQFVNIQPIRKLKMLTGEERAHLKATGYREKYLIEAGLMDNPEIQVNKFDTDKNEEEKKAISELIKGHSSSKKSLIVKKQLPKKTEVTSLKSEPVKEADENEQLSIIKRITQKVKLENTGPVNDEQTDDAVQFITELNKENGSEKLKRTESEITSKLEGLGNGPEKSVKTEELRREEDILRDLQKALDKRNKKQINEEVVTETEQITDISTTEITAPEKEAIQINQVENKKLTQEVTSEIQINQEEQSIVQLTQTEKVSTETGLKSETENAQSDEKINDTQEQIVEQTEIFMPEKNQELVDEYREKIEGAVFDKAWDELIEICTAAMNDLPFWDWPYYRRSTAWGNKREFQKVIDDCSKAIGYNPKLADAYYNRGTAKYFTGRYSDAASDYQKAIDLNYIKLADAYFNRGLCFQKIDHRKSAYIEFMKAKELGSKKAEDILNKEFQ
jgi:hypothetical protein